MFVLLALAASYAWNEDYDYDYDYDNDYDYDQYSYGATYDNYYDGTAATQDDYYAYNEDYDDDYDVNGNLFRRSRHPTMGSKTTDVAPAKTLYNADYDYDYDNDNDYDYDYDNYAYDDYYYDDENSDEEDEEEFLSRFFSDVDEYDYNEDDDYYNKEDADALAEIWNDKPDFFMKHADDASFPPALKAALFRRIKKQMKKYSKKETKKILKKRSQSSMSTIMGLQLFKKYGFPALLLTNQFTGGNFFGKKNDNLLPWLLLMDGGRGGLFGGRHRDHKKMSLDEQKRLVEKLQKQIAKKESKTTQ